MDVEYAALAPMGNLDVRTLYCEDSLENQMPRTVEFGIPALILCLYGWSSGTVLSTMSPNVTSSTNASQREKI